MAIAWCPGTQWTGAPAVRVYVWVDADRQAPLRMR